MAKYDPKTGLLSFLDLQLKLNEVADGEKIAAEIRKCSSIITLEFRGNSLGPAATDPIAKALEGHPELERVLWSDLFTGRLKQEIPIILEKLLDAITKCGAMLKELDLSDNALGPIGVKGIEKFLASEAAMDLETIKLYNNGLGIGGKTVAACFIKCLQKAVARGRWFNLKTFIAGRNRLENQCALPLAHAFKMIGTLEDIQIIQNGIWADGIRALSDCFRFNPNLRIIDLSDNTCTHRGAAAIAAVVPQLKKLERLALGDCLCRDRGTLKIFRALAAAQLVNLKELEFSGNEISKDGAQEIAKVVQTSLKKVQIKIACNNYGAEFQILKDEIGALADIDLGEESDDQGSDFDSDPLWNDCKHQKEQFPIGIITNFVKAPSAGTLKQVLARSDDIIDELENDMRVDNNAITTARFIAALSVTYTPENEKKIGKILKAILERANGIVCSNLPVESQLVNHLIAFANGVKCETKEKTVVNFKNLQTLLQGNNSNAAKLLFGQFYKSLIKA
uniref:Ran gtpase-activating protein n=1 Tax=Rhabditophanes sp. KR3021 TaxID=114890 RepID=A0AC35TJ04_9BILA